MATKSTKWAYTAGRAGTYASAFLSGHRRFVSAYIRGNGTAKSSKAVFTKGRVGSYLSAYLLGDSRWLHAYMNCVLRSRATAYLDCQVYVGPISGGPSAAYNGWTKQKAMLHGGVFTKVQKAAWALGAASTSASTSGFLSGKYGLIRRSSLTGYLNGDYTRIAASAYLEGYSMEYPYIILKTSDGGTTKTKYFRVVAQAYNDGEPSKTATANKTIGGGLDVSQGGIYLEWNPIVKVRHTEDVTDYGNMADLEYFFGLNNPNATPSSLITFVDHHGTSRNVYIMGSMPKSIVTTKVEGTTAWFFYKLTMIGTA